MKKPSDESHATPTQQQNQAAELRAKILGLGKKSHQKSYYMQLQQQYEKLDHINLLLNYNPDLMFWINPNDRVLQGLNFAARRKLLGATAVEIERSIQLSDVLHESTIEMIWNWYESPGSDVSLRFETNITTFDNAKIPVELTTIHKHEQNSDIILFICRDISAREQAQRMQTRLSFALDQIQDFLLIIDPDWSVQYANTSVSNITGYPYDEIIRRPYYILLDSNLNQAIQSELEESMEHGRVFFKSIQNTRKDGAPYTLRLSVYPIIDPKQEFNCFLMVGTDITSERETQKRLQQSQKMDALGLLAGGIAHDFNNILSIILGFSEILQMSLEGNDELSAYTSEIFTAGSRARDLVKQILTFSRKNEQEKQPVQFSLIVKEALKMLRATIPSSVDIQHDIATEALGFADPTNIHQIIMNLVTNAYHALKGGVGEIRVSLRLRNYADLPYSVRSHLQQGRYIELVVADTGEGIQQHLRDRIFEPYFTTKQPGEGTGLGLSIIHGIVEDSNGYIDVRSEPGAGATFALYFPELAVNASHETNALAMQNITGNETILLVDDEIAIIKLLERGLHSFGYNVASAMNGEEALEMYTANPDAFDIIITDQTMPKMTGDLLAAEIRRSNTSIPIILCSGYSEEITPFRLHSAQFSSIITKPVRPSTLGKLIREHLDRSGAKI